MNVNVVMEKPGRMMKFKIFKLFSQNMSVTLLKQ